MLSLLYVNWAIRCGLRKDACLKWYCLRARNYAARQYLLPVNLESIAIGAELH